VSQVEKNWIITVSTRLRDGTEKISRSPMLCLDSEISHAEAMEVAVSQFGCERVIKITEVNYARV